MVVRVKVRLRSDRIHSITRGAPGAREILRAGRAVQREAQRLAPVRTGFLRRTIVLAGPFVGPQGLFCYVIATAPYAMYQEFGTRHHRAQPFMRPALLIARV